MSEAELITVIRLLFSMMLLMMKPSLFSGTAMEVLISFLISVELPMTKDPFWTWLCTNIFLSNIPLNPFLSSSLAASMVADWLLETMPLKMDLYEFSIAISVGFLYRIHSSYPSSANVVREQSKRTAKK